ncbi:MAG: LytR C-terminal domain-containing protein [Jatrophihabitans sp.]
MGKSVIRRPLPALVSLLALLLLTGIVWWRVLNRDPGNTSATTSPTCPTTTAPSTTSPTVLPAPGAVTLQVVNSTTRNGIAASARRTLQQEGFRIPAQASNDPSTDRKKNTGVAQIRYGPTAERSAALVRYYLPGATLVRTTSTTSTIVIALGAKFTKVVDAKAVAAALRKDDRSVATTSPTPPGGTASVSC